MSGFIISGLGQKRLSLPIRLRSGSGWFGQDSRASDPVARKNKENIVKRKKIGCAQSQTS